MPSAVCNGNSRAALQGRWKFSREVTVCHRRGPGEKIKNSANAEFRGEKKGVSQNKGSSPSCPCQEGSEGHNTVSNGSSQLSLGWLFNLVGQTERRPPCWKGLTATDMGQRGLQVFPCSVAGTLPKAYGTPGAEVHAQT